MKVKNNNCPFLFKVKNSLGTLESDVMNVIWKKKKTSVKEVTETLRFNRPIAYTTTMTVMDKLFKKGFLTREKIGKAYRYCPVAPRHIFVNEALSAILQDLIASYGKAKVLFSGIRLALLHFRFSYELGSKIAPYKKPMWYGSALTVLSTFFLYSIWELLQNLEFFGAMGYIRLFLAEPRLIFNHFGFIIPAILESLPTVNLLTTIILLVLFVLLINKLVKLLELKTNIFFKIKSGDIA